MTIAAVRFEHPGRGGTIHWTVSLLVVLALHGGLLLIIMFRQMLTEPIGMPPAAVMVDLAPLPAVAPAAPAPTPPEPQVRTPPPEPPLEPQPLPEPETPKLTPSPAPHPAVMLLAPRPPKPKVKRVERPPETQREPQPTAPAPSAAAPNPPYRKAPPLRLQARASLGKRNCLHGWKNISDTLGLRRNNASRGSSICALRSIAKARFCLHG